MSARPLDIKAAWLSRELRHDRQLWRGQFSPDGRFIAAAGQDRRIYLWEHEGEEPVKIFESHHTWVSALVFHPDGRRFFTADYHGVIHCWDLQDREAAEPRWTIPAADRRVIRALLATPDGQYLISAGDDGVVKVWNAADGTPVTRLQGHRECVFSLAVSPDGQHLVSGDLLGSVRQWDLTGPWNCEREFDASLLHTRGEDFLADVGGVRSLAFSADGRWLAAGGMKEAESNAFCPGKPTVLVFDLTNGELKSELGIQGKSDGPFNALQFLEDGTLAGHTELLHSDSELVFWKIDQPDPVHSIKNPSAYDLSLHPDGRQLLATCYRSGGSTGNGAREQFENDYHPNGTALRIFSLFAKPDAQQPTGT